MRKAVLILDNIRSVENTGSIFRTADCLGVSKIYLVGTTPCPVDRFERKRKDFAKVALGAEESVSWEYVKNIKDQISNLKSEGFKIIALEQHPDAIHLTPDPSPKLGEGREERSFALIVGNEVEGVSQEALDLSDEIVEIPMQGTKESLNVSVATGIALFSLSA